MWVPLTSPAWVTPKFKRASVPTWRLAKVLKSLATFARNLRNVEKVLDFSDTSA